MKKQTAMTRPRAVVRTIRIGAEMRETKMTPRALSAFIEYRDMGPGRSLKRLFEESRNRVDPRKRFRLSTIEGWSRAYGWVEMSQAYDISLAEQVAEKTNDRRVREIEEERQEQRTLAKLARAKGYEALYNKDKEQIGTLAAIKLLEYGDTVLDRQRTEDETALAKSAAESAPDQGISSAQMHQIYEGLDEHAKVEFLTTLRDLQDVRERLRAFVPN